MNGVVITKIDIEKQTFEKELQAKETALAVLQSEKAKHQSYLKMENQKNFLS